MQHAEAQSLHAQIVMADAQASGRAQLVQFLEGAGVSGGALDRVLAVLDGEDVSDLSLLRCSFAELESRLKIGPRNLIRAALSAPPPEAKMEQEPVESRRPVYAFNVVVTFKEQTTTVRLTVPQDQYELRLVSTHLEELNSLATQHLKGSYKIVGVKLDGAALDLKKSLHAQAVQPGVRLEASVQAISVIFARAAGKLSTAVTPPPAEARVAPPPASMSASWPAQREAATHSGQKRGPRQDRDEKVDKRVKPALWKVGTPFELLNGTDATARMARMAAAVADNCGVPVADGCGKGVWCEACRKLQPLAKPFDRQNWRTHTLRRKHTAAAQLHRTLAAAARSVPEIWSDEWLAMRQGEWRAHLDERRKASGASATS